MDRRNKRKLGQEKEQIAGEYLKKQGYKILAYNFQVRGAEIDIVAREPQGSYVMCEVKYRSTKQYGEPSEAINYRKQQKICYATLFYYAKNQLPEDTPCRFDVIGISGDGQIEHIQDAFPFVQ